MNHIKINIAVFAILIFTSCSVFAQLIDTQLKLKQDNNSQDDPTALSFDSKSGDDEAVQKPTKKIYFVPGGKIGMFFLQGDYSGNQMIALEIFGKYVGDGFFAEVSLPFRFKTSPAFTDIGLDVNVFYPFLGAANKSEVEPYIGGGLGLHFIGMNTDNGSSIAARGGMGLNIIAGTVFFKDYDFNIIVELKYFTYLRDFNDLRYQGVGLNVGVTFPH